MTFRRHVHLLMLLLLLAGFLETARAQYRSGLLPAPPPSVLSPAPSAWWIGPQLGAGLNEQRGDFITDFCLCSFEDGSGTGFSAGVEIGHFLSPSFAVALKAVHNDFRAEYAYRLMLPTYVIDDDATIDVEHERKNTVVLSYLMLNPMLQFYPFGGFYVSIGPGIGIKTSATQEYSLHVTDEFEFGIGDPNNRTIEIDSGELPNAESFRADFRVGLGYNIRLGRSFLFAPEVTYAYPLTRISDDDNWFAESILLMGVFKFEL